MGQTTITVEEETLERFNRVKDKAAQEAVGAPTYSSERFITMLLDTWENDEIMLGDIAQLSEDVHEQLDRIESAASAAEERTGQIQGTLDELGGR